jgi:diguanylate cyclase (GGDEF)-like protein
VVLLIAPLAILGARGELWHFVAMTVANFVALLALTNQLRRGAYTDRVGWVVMTVGMLLLLVHNAEHAVTQIVTGTPDSGAFSLLSLLVAYLVLLTGGMLVTVPYTRRDSGGIIDAAVIGLAAASVLWATLLGPTHQRIGSSSFAVIYDMALVLLITAMSGAVVRAAVTAPEARPAALYLLTAITATNVADIASTLVDSSRIDNANGWIGGLWVVAYLTFAAGALHPSATAIAGPERPPLGLTRARLVFLGVALAVNPAIAGFQQALGHPADVTLLSVGSLLIVPLVVSRIGLLARWHAEAVDRLHDLASLDELTGLPNRRVLTGRLEMTLAAIADGRSPGAVVLYLDLDGFKSVNDDHGHAAGDLLLREVAVRLRSCVRASDLVARCGGDEFVVLLEGATETAVPAVVSTVEGALEAPVALGAVVTSARSSIGVAVVRPTDLVDAEAILARADCAMYEVKKARQRRVVPGADQLPARQVGAPVVPTR